MAPVRLKPCVQCTSTTGCAAGLSCRGRQRDSRLTTSRQKVFTSSGDGAPSDPEQGSLTYATPLSRSSSGL
jgi:hypothetical protein